jgi:hypothetical protein
MLDALGVEKELNAVKRELGSLRDEINVTKWQIIVFCVMLFIADIGILTIESYLQKEAIHSICRS